MLRVEEWPLDRLVEYARNPRKNDEQVDRMCGAIREFGFRIPIVAKSDGTVVDGHLRLKAARKLGIQSVPVALADELTEAQIKAFRLLANKSVSWAQWDNDLLKLELDELKGFGFDLELTGFSLDELAILTDLGDTFGVGSGESGAGSLADRFMIPPFSVLNAREGWWQDRKRAWLALGIESELGRGDSHQFTNGSRQSMEYVGGSMPRHGAKASPGGSLMPAADYRKRQRGDGKGRPIGQK